VANSRLVFHVGVRRKRQDDAVGEGKRKARRAARSRWTQGLARWGLVSKGVLYVLVGAIAVHVSVGGGERIADRGGALSAVADHWLGQPLIAGVAFGLAGYTVWRLAEAFLGTTLESSEDEGWLKRGSFVAKAAWYGGLSAIAFSVLLGADEQGGRQEDRATAWVLERPLGRWIVAAVGLGILGAGVFNVWRGVTTRFRKNLKTRKMSELEDRGFSAIGAVGHVARGLVFGVIGLFLVRAAYQYDPKETVGLDGALSEIVRNDYGDTLLGLVAAGLLAYGLYCFVEARYREV
jgi:hypothetical protein